MYCLDCSEERMEAFRRVLGTLCDDLHAADLVEDARVLEGLTDMLATATPIKEDSKSLSGDRQHILNTLKDLSESLWSESRPFQAMDVDTAIRLIEKTQPATYVVSGEVDNGAQQYPVKIVVLAKSPEHASRTAADLITSQHDTTLQIDGVEILTQPCIFRPM